MTVADVAAAFKDAMVTAATTAINDPAVQVCYGHPGTVGLADDIVSVGRITSAQETGPMSVTNRSRTNILTAELVFSCFRHGGPDQEKVAGDRAYALLSAVEEYVRVTDTTLGGTVMWCFCTSHDSQGSTDPALLAQGRCIEITATFTAYTRIHTN